MKYHLTIDNPDPDDVKITACGETFHKYYNHSLSDDRFETTLDTVSVTEICDICKEAYYGMLQTNDRL